MSSSVGDVKWKCERERDEFGCVSVLFSFGVFDLSDQAGDGTHS